MSGLRGGGSARPRYGIRSSCRRRTGLACSRCAQGCVRPDRSVSAGDRAAVGGTGAPERTRRSGHGETGRGRLSQGTEAELELSPQACTSADLRDLGSPALGNRRLSCEAEPGAAESAIRQRRASNRCCARLRSLCEEIPRSSNEMAGRSPECPPDPILDPLSGGLGRSDCSRSPPCAQVQCPRGSESYALPPRSACSLLR